MQTYAKMGKHPLSPPTYRQSAADRRGPNPQLSVAALVSKQQNGKRADGAAHHRGREQLLSVLATHRARPRHGIAHTHLLEEAVAVRRRLQCADDVLLAGRNVCLGSRIDSHMHKLWSLHQRGRIAAEDLIHAPQPEAWIVDAVAPLIASARLSLRPASCHSQVAWHGASGSLDVRHKRVPVRFETLHDRQLLWCATGSRKLTSTARHRAAAKAARTHNTRSRTCFAHIFCAGAACVLHFQLEI